MRSKFYFDCAAILIMIITYVYSVQYRRAKNGKNRFLRIILNISIVATILTIAEQVIIKYYPEHVMHRVLTDGFYSIACLLIAPAFMMYLVYAVNMSHRIKFHKKEISLLGIPAIVCILNEIVVVGIAIINKGAFDNTKYTNGTFIIVTIEVLFYTAVGLVFLFKNRNALDNNRWYVLISPVFFASISMILRFFWPNSQSILFVVSMSFLLIMLFNEGSEGLIDAKTGFKTQTALVSLINSAQKVKRKFCIIIVDITNYNLILNRVGYEEIEESVAYIAGLIKKDSEYFKLDEYETFYNGNGCFYIILPGEDLVKAELVANVYFEDFVKKKNLGEVDYSFAINECLVNFPGDVQDVESIRILSEDLRKTPHTLRVMKAEDLNSSQNFEVRRQMNKIIDSAISNSYFSVYYQPIYSVKEDKFLSAEALIRLNDPVHGFISPGVFIPLAEKSGAIHRLGGYVTEEVCKFISSGEFKKLGVEYIEINLSVAQCHRANLIEEIESIREKYGVGPEQINLEITETAACYSENRLLSNIRSLHNLGYSFSLDDFGTGYSNLIRMASLPINIVKLDRTFVLMREENERFHIVIKNMIKMLKRMGLKILVEGIETQEMVESFSDMGVDYIQGFYYSKPIPKDEYITFIQEYNQTGNAGKTL